MNERLLYFEADDTSQAYYLAVTKGGALYYGAADINMGLKSAWKLVRIDENNIEKVH